MLKRENFRSGLVIEDTNLLTAPTLSVPTFTVPPYIDSVYLCIPSSSQGDKPHCAGYATAGAIEVEDWLKTHVAAQRDGDLIYSGAKEIDKDKKDGTSLSSAIKSAQNLGWIDKTKKIKLIENEIGLKFALHTHRVCIAGFDITNDWFDCNPSGGVIPNKETKGIGGHAVLICWFDSFGIGFQNSWGKDWGCQTRDYLQGFGRLSWEQFDRQFLYAAIVE